MSNDFFCFEKSRPIVIYGGNETGIGYYRKLVMKGYTVQCFIDEHANDYNGMLIIDEREIPIYKPAEVNILDLEIIIIIAIRNAIEQTNVAKYLWQKSYQNIIFFPMIKENKYNAKALIILKEFYKTLNTEKIQENAVLPRQQTLWGNSSFWDHAFVVQKEKYILAWMPISLIHYYTIEQMEKLICKHKITVGTEEKNFDKNVFQLKWINDLFNFFVNGKGDLEYYWEVEKLASNYVKRQSIKENQLWFSDRQKCIELLMSGMNTGNDFFYQNSIPVQWNKKGYFNICDGGHRLAFFNCINLSMVPVQISLTDYEKWLNKEELNKCLNYIIKNKITNFEAPIPHPWFYGCEVMEEKFGKTILKSILEQMMQLNIYENYSVLDLNPKEGYYLRYFVRNHANGVTGVVYNNEQRDFITHINRLFYLESYIDLVSVETEKKKNEKYDVLLVFKLLCDLTEEEQIEAIKWISLKTKKMIIWESGAEYEKEKQLILQYSSFHKYIFLKKVLSGNIIREVGMFLKDIK